MSMSSVLSPGSTWMILNGDREKFVEFGEASPSYFHEPCRLHYQLKRRPDCALPITVKLYVINHQYDAHRLIALARKEYREAVPGEWNIGSFVQAWVDI